MKSVLISIQPKWCEKICHEIGKDEMDKPIYEKRIEVRKSAPKEVPFKAYIYETKDKKIECGFHFEDTGITLREKYVFGMHKARIIKHYRNEGRGKVIGEFICDRIDEYKYVYCDHPEIGYPVGYDCGDNWYDIDDEDLQKACLTEEEFKRYGNGKPLYGWRIADLKIYDKPRELSEFYSIDESGSDCCIACVYHETPLDEMPCRTCTSERRYLYRPPQSWQYVEELGE